VSFFRELRDRVKEGLRRSRQLLDDGLGAVLSIGRPVDESMLEELEEVLIAADLGVSTAGAFVSRVRDEVKRGRVSSGGDVRELLRQFLAETLGPAAGPLRLDGRPAVVLVLGVNGAGKTTTIGKLARQLKQQGLKVMLAAGDTFRAAAVEQLQVWGDRNDVTVIAQATGADPAAVVFDALQAARARRIDVLLADTAGRLHTQSNLMDELKKVKRVMGRVDERAPHEVLLVLDASQGQNALQQARLFNDALGVTGVVLTKLDGTAKGGIVFAIASQLRLPIRYIGIGESAEDFAEFDAEAFVDALLKRE
jgi:fused signal recognition particle receptor